MGRSIEQTSEGFFEVIVAAGESGVPPKPHPAVFDKVLEVLNISDSQSVYVGNDWEMDLCGAKEAGIQPIWIQHALFQRSWPTVKNSVPIINTLKPLLQLEQLINKTN